MNLFFSQGTVLSGWGGTFQRPVIQSLYCRPLNISLENLPAATWCKVRHSQPGALTSLTWSVDWEHDQSALQFGHFRPVIVAFTELWRTVYKWLEGISVVSPWAHCSCSTVLNQYAFFFFCRPTLSTLQWMENILVLLPKHRQEHGLCRRTAACALLQVFSHRAVFSSSLIATSTPCKPL